MASSAHIIRRRRNRKQRHAKIQRRSRTWTIFAVIVLLVLVGLPTSVVFGGAAVVYAREVASLPQPGDTLDSTATVGATRLYDRSGQVELYTVQDPLGDTRQWLRLDELPPYIAQATLLVEDEAFYDTVRFDPLRTTTRLWRNLLTGPLEGENTLTGRLVRNAIVPSSEFVRRDDRTREIALTAEINRRYTPDQILEWHLNTNYYGSEAYGIDAAARVYLGKSARELTLDEAALLASIPTAPEFNPIDDEVAARGRQNDTLRRMLLGGAVTQAQYDLASQTVTSLLSNAGQKPDVAPEFALYARKQAERILDDLGLNGGRLVSRGGLKIITTLDTDLYYQSECVLRSHLSQLVGVPQSVTALDGNPCTAASYLTSTPPAGDAVPDSGMLLIVDVATGEIRSMVGAATATVYQPGITLYPFVYFEAFRDPSRQVFTPATMLLDVPTNFPGQVEGLIYPPVNPDGQFHGPLSLREAVGRALLTPTAQVANTFGLSSILRSAHLLGLNSLDEGVYHLSLLERGGEVSLLDVAYAYSVLSTMGEMRGVPVEPRDRGFRTLDPAAVLRIEAADGTVLWEYSANANRQNIFSAYSELGYLVNNVFGSREEFGESNVLTLERPAAVVNGLTSDKLDNWTVGYTPQLVVGVHLSRADRTATSLSPYALEGAAPIWNAVMQYAHNRDALPPVDWTRPPKVVELQVCQRSGLLPNGVCPTERELFIQDIVPVQTDTYWQAFEVNSQTGDLATENTPDALTVLETYFVPPNEALDWWKANRQKLPPTEYDTVYRSENDPFGSTAITAPEPYSYVQGIVEIRGNINTDNLDRYTLAYGEGINPNQWLPIVEGTSFTPGSALGQWDTSTLDGFYTLELTSVLQSGIPARATVQVRVDNNPPTVTVATTEPGKIYRFPEEPVITVQADVQDNFVIERVEFYHNELLVATDKEFPYTFDYAIPGVGVEYFRAEAYDAAGNGAISQEIQVEVRR